MKIAILTVGSRGDVQPFVALGVGLQAAGHSVTVCASERFGEFVRGRGLRYAYMNDDLIRIVETDEGRGAIERGGRSLRLFAQSRPLVRRSLDEQWEAARRTEAIIYHPYALAGSHIAEKLGVPSAMAAPLPLVSPTGAFENPMMPGPRLGGRFNHLSHRAVRAVMAASYWGVVRRWRKEVLRLPPRPWFGRGANGNGNGPTPVLYGHSPHVIPDPPDWPETTAATGYWFLDRDDDWVPSAALRAFLDAGPPPVYVGFGSMMVREPQRLTALVVEALRRSGRRGILATGWGALSATELPHDAFAVNTVPHGWLFPRVAAVVHHGGAGTTAAGLRAGRPTVICPFLGDQPFWGRRIFELGVGPRPVPYRKLSARKLAKRIQRAVTDEEMRRQAHLLGEKIRAEDGVGGAVKWATAWLNRAAPSSAHQGLRATPPQPVASSAST